MLSEGDTGTTSRRWVKKALLWGAAGIAGILLLIAGAIVCCPALLFLFVEPNIECKRGSRAFDRRITSPEVRDFPVLKPTSDAAYADHAFADLGEVAFQEVTYTSKEDKNVLRDTLTAHLIAKGFHRSDKRPSYYSYGSKDDMCFVRNAIECNLKVENERDGGVRVVLRAIDWAYLGVKDEEGMKNYWSSQ